VIANASSTGDQEPSENRILPKKSTVFLHFSCRQSRYDSDLPIVVDVCLTQGVHTLRVVRSQVIAFDQTQASWNQHSLFGRTVCFLEAPMFQPAAPYDGARSAPRDPVLLRAQTSHPSESAIAGSFSPSLHEGMNDVLFSSPIQRNGGNSTFRGSRLSVQRPPTLGRPSTYDTLKRKVPPPLPAGLPDRSKNSPPLFAAGGSGSATLVHPLHAGVMGVVVSGAQTLSRSWVSNTSAVNHNNSVADGSAPGAHSGSVGSGPSVMAPARKKPPALPISHAAHALQQPHARATPSPPPAKAVLVKVHLPTGYTSQ